MSFSLLIHYFNEGGLLMWPILLCSIFSLGVFLNRSYRLRKKYWVPSRIGEIESDRKKIDQQNLTGRVIVVAQDISESQKVELKVALEREAEKEVQMFTNTIEPLSLIARSATLLGLLGTVIGMIQGFEELSKSGVEKEQLAAAIGVALLTTAGGLCVALFSMYAEYFLLQKVRLRSRALEQHLTQYLSQYSIS